MTDFAQAFGKKRPGDPQERTFQDYIGRGLYYDQLKKVLRHVRPGSGQSLSLRGSERCTPRTVQDTFRFLKVDDSFVPDVSLRRNVSGHPKYKTLDGF